MTAKNGIGVGIDPQNPEHHGKPVWAVYGPRCAPSIICAKLRAYDKDEQLLPTGARGASVCIWGYSVYRQEPGFRTLGINVIEFARREEMCVFFTVQEFALDFLALLTTPKKGTP